MDLPVINPAAFQTVHGNRPEQLGGTSGISNGGNTFNAFNFVVLSSGILAAIATGATLCCGQVLDASNTTTIPTPPYQMFGPNHYPLSLFGSRFAISITNNAGAIGQANSAPTLSNVAVGTTYGVKLVSGIHMLNIQDTTNLLMQVVQIPDQWNSVVYADSGTIYNPVVIVQFVPATIQAV